MSRDIEIERNTKKSDKNNLKKYKITALKRDYED